jgi:uncharacterized repeat protein (TIGR03803 family)
MPLRSGFPWCAVLFVATLSIAVHASASPQERIIHNFEPYVHGTYPVALALDAQQNIYGAADGGLYGQGVIFQLTRDPNGAWTQTILYNFAGGSDGSYPICVVLNGGNIYGLTNAGGANSSGTFFELTPTGLGQWKESVLYSFPDLDGGGLNGGLSQDAAGNFYGTIYAYQGFSGNNYGSLFQLTQSSPGVWTENVLYAFTNGDDGGSPRSIPIFDSAGNLYGTTISGGTADFGLVFEFSPSAGGVWNETVLYDFTGTADGFNPQSLVFDQAGNLFGTTANGGSDSYTCGPDGGCGTIFELQPGANGAWTKTTLYKFENNSLQDIPSFNPSNLVIDGRGNLYGFTYWGGGGSEFCSELCGTAFELSPAGSGQWAFHFIFEFGGNDNGPSGVILGAGERLYGIANSSSPGTPYHIFQLTPAWTLTNIYDFHYTDAATPFANLTPDSQEHFYGTAAVGGTHNIGAVFEMIPDTSSGWKENLIYSFGTGSPFRGFYPVYPSAVVFDGAGNMYGTTTYGGFLFMGSVFQLVPTVGGGWTENDLFQFSGSIGYPRSGVVLDQSGNLYGTTGRVSENAIGTVFEVSPGENGQWTESTIHTFAGYPNDGNDPGAGLIMDKAGNLYGTTLKGGNSGNCTEDFKAAGCGVVFELSQVAGGWKSQILYSFQGGDVDGASPAASLIFDEAGNLYGTTQAGGIENCSGLHPNCGIVFELSPNGQGGWSETILHEFTNSNGDGGAPAASLVFDSAGNLYGTTTLGGVYGSGIVFKLTPGVGGWTESILHSFGNGYDGATPEAGVTFDTLGNLYGTTSAGGSDGSGTVFEIVP